MTTSETDHISDFVLGVIRDMLNMPLPQTTSAETPLGAGGLELESLSFVELTVHVERHYHIQIDDEFVDGLATMALVDLVTHIQTLAFGSDDAGAAEGDDLKKKGLPTRMEIKQLLVDSQIVPDQDPRKIADDDEVVLDSLNLVWLAHQLNEQYGTELETDHPEARNLTSVAAIDQFLQDQGKTSAHTGGTKAEVAGR